MVHPYFGSEGSENEKGYYGIRPVVYLKTNTTVNDLKILGEQQEPEW